MSTWILAYFVVSALVAAFLAADHHEGRMRVGFAVLLAAFGPVLSVGSAVIEAWSWLREYGQLATFWYFIVNRKRLQRSREELEFMHRITLKYRTSGSLHHRLWRLAERCYFIANEYEP